ncbi:MAG: hypothetical protein EBX36_01725 [Planctomycetia bacterium]|nr:hypothetical protein [Planctomycetia bacterium]
MAANNSNVVQQSLTIALIVFVMLTFVLAVTTYLFFKKADENLKTMEEAQRATTEEKTKRLEAEKNRIEIVKDVLGYDREDIANPDILKDKRDDIDGMFGSQLQQANLQPTYRDTLKWLSSSYQDHYKAMANLQEDKDRFAVEKTDLQKKHTAELETLKKLHEDAKADYAAATAGMKEGAARAAEQLKKLEAERDNADAQTKRLRLLSDKIAEAKPYLSLDRQQKWPGDAEPADGGLNQLVGKLRVADEPLQRAVMAATPKDDRIDGFDGRILSVNELDRTVLVACGTTSGLRAGLLFNVYDPTDPRPQFGSNKATIEVLAIESDSLVRCRVRQDTVRDPIIPGDTVATSLWSPGTPLEVVIVGLVQLGGTPDADLARLKQLIERVGGTIAETVSASTTLVVDAGSPRVKGLDAEGQVASRKQWTPKQKENRDLQIKKANSMGIRVLAIEPFLDMLGLQTQAVRANRLPVPVEERAAPTPSAGLAF